MKLTKSINTRIAILWAAAILASAILDSHQSLTFMILPLLAYFSIVHSGDKG